MKRNCGKTNTFSLFDAARDILRIFQVASFHLISLGCVTFEEMKVSNFTQERPSGKTHSEFHKLWKN